MGRFNTLFLDVGGVLLTNGWDSKMRRRAAEKFCLDPGEMDERHHLIDVNYELGQLSLDDYLDCVVFFRSRPFTREAFKEFMYAQSEPFPEMIGFVRELKEANDLRIVVVSNEGRELTQYRIDQFGLREIVDVFIVSCFVGYRKPDAAIYNAALDVVQTDPDRVIYVDDRAVFVEAAERLGIRSIQHIEPESTKEQLADCGLTVGVASLM